MTSVARQRRLLFLFLAAVLGAVLVLAGSVAGGGTISGGSGPSASTPPATAAAHPAAAHVAGQSSPDGPGTEAGDTAVVHSSPDGPGTEAEDTAVVHCPDHWPPLPACHDQGEYQSSPNVAAPRPDIDTAWGAAGGAPAHDAPPAARAGGHAPDLTALSISRT